MRPLRKSVANLVRGDIAYYLTHNGTHNDPVVMECTIFSRTISKTRELMGFMVLTGPQPEFKYKSNIKKPVYKTTRELYLVPSAAWAVAVERLAPRVSEIEQNLERIRGRLDVAERKLEEAIVTEEERRLYLEANGLLEVEVEE